MQLRRLSLVTLSLVAGCVSRPLPPPPRPAPPIVRPVPPPPAPAANWEDRDVTPGTWTYARDARGSIALYGIPGTAAEFTLRCDSAARQVYASRPGAIAGTLTLRATTGARGYAAVPTGSVPPYVAATLAPRDPQLDALAFSRGRILIGLTGAPDIIVPSWPELTRVIEDCR